MATFVINDGDPTNTADSYYGPWSTPWALATEETFSAATRNGIRLSSNGTTTADITSNHVKATAITIRLGSETTPLATGRGRIWTTGGTSKAYSDSVSIRQDSATPFGLYTFNLNNGSPTLLNPGSAYKFGFYISSGTSNSRLNYDYRTESGANVYLDNNSTYNGSFTENSTLRSGASLIGNVTYYTFPDAPILTPGTGGTTSSIQFTIDAGDVTYSGPITSYLVQYKESTSTDWITDNPDAVAGSYSIGNLLPGKSYNVRVSAKNETTEFYETQNVVADTHVTGPFAAATYSVKTFGNRFTNDSGTNSTLSTIKRFVGIGLSTTDGSGNTIAADADGYVNLTIGKRFNGTTWTDIG